MDTNKILAWVATIVAVPAVFWLFATVSQNSRTGAINAKALQMMQQEMVQEREERRQWREDMADELGGLSRSLTEMAKGFYEMKGVFKTLQFEVDND